MKITCGPHMVETSCRGCYCHDMAMQFGQDSDVCQECGCPKTKAGFYRVVVQQVVEKLRVPVS